MNHRQDWELVRKYLSQARKTLPSGAETDQVICHYEEFLANNELELACDMLDSYAQDHPVPLEFWVFLRGAAHHMQQRDRERRYDANATAR